MAKKTHNLSFIFAVTILIIESLYIVNGFFKKTDFQSINSQLQSASNSSVAERKISNLNKYKGNTSGALNKSYVNYLESLKRDAILSVTATLACSGSIEKVYTKPWVNHDLGDFKYELGLKLKDAIFDCQYLQFDKLSSQNLKFYKIVNGNKVEINFSDLRVGDKIITKTEIDLLSPQDQKTASNIIRTTIIKL